MKNRIISIDTESGNSTLKTKKNEKQISTNLAFYIMGNKIENLVPELRFSGAQMHYVVEFEVTKKELKLFRADYISAKETTLKSKKINQILESDDCQILHEALMDSKLSKKVAKSVAKLIIKTVDDSEDDEY